MQIYWVHAICNEDGDYLSIDKDSNMELGKGYDSSRCEQRKIAALELASGVLSTKLLDKWSMQYFIAPMAYVGFKELFDFPVSDEYEKSGADYFQIFITQILNIGKINAIGNANGDIWLVSGDKYSIVKTPPILNSKKIK